MYKKAFTYITLGLIFAVFVVSSSSQTVDSASTATDTTVLPDEDFEDFFLDSETDEYHDDRELAKRAPPKLRRIFIGKRDMEDNSNEWIVEGKRSHPRRHLFIGKRNGDRMKKGRVHRIFIG